MSYSKNRKCNPMRVTTALSPDTVKRLIAACGRGPIALRNRALFDLLYHSGLRISEALALRRADCNGRSIEVRHGKGGKARTVRLLTTYGHWEAWLAECRGEIIFPVKDGSAMSADYVRGMLARVAKRANLTERVHLHAFRHGHSCQLYRAMDDIAAVQRQLGHARITTTADYLRGLTVDVDQLDAVAF